MDRTTSSEEKNIEMLSGVKYKKIDDAGLHIEKNQEEMVLDVDNVIICAGQESSKDYKELKSKKKIHVIGGACKASELDALYATEQGMKLALKI